MKRITSVLLIVLSLVISGCQIGADTTFHSQGVALTNEVADLLVRRGVCPSEPKICIQKSVGFYPVRRGLSFSTIDIDNPDIIQEIKDIVVSTFNANPNITMLSYKAYLMADPPLNSSFNGGGPMIDSIELRR